MAKKNQRRDGIVFSTNPDFGYDENDDMLEATPPPNQQNLKISLDRLKGNKKVTRIYNFTGNDDDLKVLGKQLKALCGCGGTTKNQAILLQGDFIQKAMDFLQKEGYKVKRSGG